MDKSIAHNAGRLGGPQSTPVVASRTDGQLQIERLMSLAFFPGRAPRSAEYRDGCQAVLEYRILGRRMRQNYPAGCCEADAWYAGAEEGHVIWRRKSASQELAEVRDDQ